MTLDFTEEELEFLEEGWSIDFYVGSPVIAIRIPKPDLTECTSEAQIQETLTKYFNRKNRKAKFISSLPKRLKGLKND
jgi:hypothetical protein